MCSLLSWILLVLILTLNTYCCYCCYYYYYYCHYNYYKTIRINHNVNFHYIIIHQFFLLHVRNTLRNAICSHKSDYINLLIFLFWHYTCNALLRELLPPLKQLIEILPCGTKYCNIWVKKYISYQKIVMLSVGCLLSHSVTSGFTGLSNFSAGTSIEFFIC